MSESKLTIVIPVYNRESLVERTLDSIAAQTLRPFDLIVVDNNSTDNSLQVIREWAERHKTDTDLHVEWTSEVIAGAAAARNTGLALVTTPIVMFFDSDDEMYPTLAASVVEAFDALPALDILAWQVLTQSSDGLFRLTKPFSRRHPMSTHIIHSTLSTLRFAAKTEFVRKVGGWNESVRAWDDLELGVRLLAAHPVVRRLESAPLAKTYYTPFSISASKPTTRESSDLEHALNCCEENLAIARRHDAIKWIDVRRVILAADYARGGNRPAARRLMSSLVSGHKWIYRLLYFKHRLFSRGTHLLAPFPRC